MLEPSKRPKSVAHVLNLHECLPPNAIAQRYNYSSINEEFGDFATFIRKERDSTLLEYTNTS